MKQRKVIIVLLIVLIIGLTCSSCSTSRAVIDRPTRPTLEYVETDIPLAAQRNMLSLITYIKQLENIVAAYERMIE